MSINYKFSDDQWQKYGTEGISNKLSLANAVLDDTN